jgi:hypothetical protein
MVGKLFLAAGGVLGGGNVGFLQLDLNVGKAFLVGLEGEELGVAGEHPHASGQPTPKVGVVISGIEGGVGHERYNGRVFIKVKNSITVMVGDAVDDGASEVAQVLGGQDGHDVAEGGEGRVVVALEEDGLDVRLFLVTDDAAVGQGIVVVAVIAVAAVRGETSGFSSGGFAALREVEEVGVLHVDYSDRVFINVEIILASASLS